MVGKGGHGEEEAQLPNLEPRERLQVQQLQQDLNSP